MRVSAVIVLILLAFSVTGCRNRYEEMSEAQIKAELLRDLPLGSSSEKVRSYLKRKTGKDPFYMRNIITSEWTKPIIGAGAPINNHHYAGMAEAELANYGAVFMVSTQVEARFELDAADRLIDLRVRKSAVGP